MYFGLHNHTQYSNVGSNSLDSINKLEDLVQTAKALGMAGLAITEHDCLSGTMKVNQMQKKLIAAEDPFKLAIGNEIYLIDEFPDKDVRMRYYHFILVAKDKIGYQALVELSSKAWYRSDIRYGKRRVPTLKSDIEEVMKWAAGHLVASTACLGGELAFDIVNKKFDEAGQFLSWMVNLFKEDCYIEMQPSDSKEQIAFNHWVIDNFHPRNCVITTDAHYLKEEDFPIQEAFLRSQQENREVKEYYAYAHLMGEDEIFKLMELSGANHDYVQACLNNTMKIMNQIEYYDLEQVEIIPRVDMPEIELTISTEHKADITKYEWLNKSILDKEPKTRYCGIYCLNSLEKKGKWNETYLKALDEEFDVFYYQTDRLKSNFFSYFNGIQHFIDLAWSVDCAVGPSRGSAGGCLTCYLMDVTQEDPIQYGLYFWRFANKDRVELADIDTDFAPSRKPQFFEAIRKERGELGLTQVSTFKTLTLKAAIGNAARGYRSKEFPNGLDPDNSRYLSSLVQIYRGGVATLKQTLEGDEEKGFTKNYSFIKKCEEYPGLLDIIYKFEGLIVNSSTHASAVILFDEEDTIYKHCGLMRAPNGDLCTCYELHDCSSAGMVKYDFLLLSTLDILTACFDLLREEEVIDPNLSLKECFEKYIDVNKIDYDDPRIWKHLYDNDVLSIFQFDAASGRKGVLATKPKSLEEMTTLNGAIRLITPEGEEDQIERFAKFGEDLSLFEIELNNHNVPERMKQIIHQELDKTNGCCLAQETLMILCMSLAHFSMKEANKIRKVLAKKKVNEIEEQRQLFCGNMKDEVSEETANYLWRTFIQPQMNYSFCKAHGLAYSMVGVQCIEAGGILFHPIFWQTACLLQRSGALDNKSADYNKIAKAVSTLLKQNCNIHPLNINKSKNEFKLDVANNIIYFGFAGVKGLKAKAIESIMQNRPYTTFYDFLGRTEADVPSIVNLIKAGAFDDFDSRENLIETLARYKADTKMKLNGQNFSSINKLGIWPTETEELELARKIFIFTQYLKAISLKDDPENYNIADDDACAFLDEIGYEHEGETLSKIKWKTFYDLRLEPMKLYLIEHQEEMLEKMNRIILDEWKEKYFPENENESIWEIATMGICFGEHPMKDVINLSNFEDLPMEPEIDYIYHPKKTPTRDIPIYKLDMIAGYVIAKDKLHSSFTLLTTGGPVEVKMRKEEFAHYDAQISKKDNASGKKTILEKSWLNRGNAVIVHGMRQDDQFIAKVYKNSPMKHTIYKITNLIENNTKFEVQKDRKKGIAEEAEEED